MEQELLCQLSEKKRILNYPYRLCAIGWMPHHFYFHRDTVINGCFICLSTNLESPSESIVNGHEEKFGPYAAPHFGYLRRGTTITSIRASVHDELYFQYPPECADAVDALIGPALGRETKFFFPSFPEDIIAAIRTEISAPDSPGAADRLDQLAIRLFTEIIVRRNAATENVRCNYLKLHAVADGLLNGRELPELLREYAFSERTFYREWKKIFSKSPAAYRIDRALSNACALLASTELTPAEIAEQCGFAGMVYFYQLFRKRMHTTPLKFRAERKNRLFPKG